MKASPSIELIWQLAAREATVGKFAEIKPEHFCIALMKLSELPVNDAMDISPDSKVARQLADEVSAVRRDLGDRGIDAKRIRRELRSQLGVGQGSVDGSSIHRSPESRSIFDTAVRLVGKSGDGMLRPSHILEALFSSPTKAMVSVFESAGGQAFLCPGALKPPMLTEFSYDLTDMAARGKLSKVAGARKAEAKALLQRLAQADRKSLLLVCDTQFAGRSVILAAAHAVANGDSPFEKQEIRLLDLRFYSPVQNGIMFKWEIGLKPLLDDQHYCMRCGAVTDPESNCILMDDFGGCCERCRDKQLFADEQLHEAFGEAATSKGVVLVLPDMISNRRKEEVAAWTDALKAGFSEGTVQCICLVTSSDYRSYLEKDRDWGKLAHVMWIRDEAGGDIPDEL